MLIWIIDHYSVPVKYYPLARNTNFAKNLMKMGHEVIIFAASTVHNSDVNLIKDNKEYTEIISDGVKYVLVKCHQYSGNGAKRIINMYEFANRLESVCDNYIHPDAIISTSMTLFACKKGIQIGQKYKCKKIAQITDLWPESIIAYGIAGRYHPLVLLFRQIEKWIYKNADQVIFSMEGAYDYIIEQKWETILPRSKAHFINNGVDLEQFDYNREHFQISDADLDDPYFFKVVYIGAIRRVNNLGRLLDAAKLVKNEKVRFLIWGNGDELENLKQRVINENIGNVVFKGRVDKNYIPYITSSSDLNMMHGDQTPILRFGISPNKLFDYFAAGKAILSDFKTPYNPANTFSAGEETSDLTSASIAESVDKFSNMTAEEIEKYEKNARIAAQEYSFDHLTKKLLAVIEIA